MFLIDPIRRNELEVLGYTKFPLFLPEDLKAIKQFHSKIESQHNVEKGRMFHTTMNTNDEQLIELVHQQLFPYFKRHLSSFVNDCKYTLAGFLVKESGKKSAVTIHQDWNYVDESLHSSFSFWVALEDTNVWNGCMQFIPGSRRFFPSLRISPDIPDYFDGFKEMAADYLVNVPSRAGECVMFNQSIIHASRRNFSGRQRIACILGAYPDNADLLHHYRPPENSLDKIEVHRISVRSMIGMKKDQRPPHSKMLGHVSYTPPIVDFKSFEFRCRNSVSQRQFHSGKLLNLFLGKSV